MSRDAEAYRAAAQRARMARHRFLDDLSDARGRFSPTRLKRDISEAASHQADLAKMKAKDAVRRHPYSIGAVGVGVFALLFRKPIAALSRWIWVGGTKAWHAWQDRRDEHDD